MIKLYTLGFTKIGAETFFDRLTKAGVETLVDIRLNNVSQLAGFAKRDDLAYFCRQHGINYRHMPDLAPTKDILDNYKKNKGSWEDYVSAFQKLMEERQIEKQDAADMHKACLLCSEHTPHNCHRRLFAEYWQQHWPDLQVEHL